MKNILLFLLFTLLLSSLISAQKPDVNLGELILQGDNLSRGDSRIITVDDSSYYVQIATDKNAKVVKYNHQHIEQRQWIFDTKRKNKPYFDAFVRTKENVFGIIKNCDRKENQCYLKVALFDNGQFGELKTVFAHNYEKYEKKSAIKDAHLLSDDDLFQNLEYNQDSTKIAYFSLVSKRKGDRRLLEKYAVAVFDQNMEMLWQNIAELPYIEALTHTEKVSISYDGSIFLSARVKKDINNPAYNYKLFHIQADKMQEYDIMLKEGLWPSCSAVLADENSTDIQIIGLYNDLNFEGKILGTFYCKLSLKDKSSEIKIYPFEEKIKDQLNAQIGSKLHREGILSDKTRLNEVYQAKNIIKTKDNKLCFLAAYLDHRDDDPNNPNRNYLLEKSFLFASFDDNGELLQLSNIAREKETNLNQISYGYHFHDNKAYFLFLHKPSKKERKSLGIKPKSSIGVITIIDTKANTQSREVLFRVKNGTIADFTHFESIFYNGKVYFGSTRYVTKYFSKFYFNAGILSL